MVRRHWNLRGLLLLFPPCHFATLPSSKCSHSNTGWEAASGATRGTDLCLSCPPWPWLFSRVLTQGTEPWWTWWEEFWKSRRKIFWEWWDFWTFLWKVEWGRESYLNLIILVYNNLSLRNSTATNIQYLINKPHQANKKFETPGLPSHWHKANKRTKTGNHSGSYLYRKQG